MFTHVLVTFQLIKLGNEPVTTSKMPGAKEVKHQRGNSNVAFSETGCTFYRFSTAIRHTEELSFLWTKCLKTQPFQVGKVINAAPIERTWRFTPIVNARLQACHNSGITEQYPLSIMLGNFYVVQYPVFMSERKCK